MSPRQPLVDGARVLLARGFASKSAIHREVSHREENPVSGTVGGGRHE
jgi:hypothetical protein